MAYAPNLGPMIVGFVLGLAGGFVIGLFLFNVVYIIGILGFAWSVLEALSKMEVEVKAEVSGIFKSMPKLLATVGGAAQSFLSAIQPVINSLGPWFYPGLWLGFIIGYSRRR